MSVSSVSKAAQVLQVLAHAPAGQSVRQLADRLGIPRSTVHGLCSTLCVEGLLERVPGGGYRLGLTLVELGGHVISRTGLIVAAEGVLEHYAPVPGAEVHLSQFINGWVVYLHRGGGCPNAVGMSVPAHRTGAGQAVLAALPWDLAVQHVRRACAAQGRPLPDLAALAVTLARAAERGYAICDSYRPGRVSVAAPIRDACGRPVGAVSLVGPGDHFPPSAVRRSGRDVLDVTGRIGRRLRR